MDYPIFVFIFGIIFFMFVMLIILFLIEPKPKEQNITPIVTLMSTQNYMISSKTQPINDNVYIATWGCQSVTLPTAEGFNNTFKIIIKAVGTNIKLNMASVYSNDIVIFNGEAYVNGDYFELANRGFVELSWNSGGWTVMSNYGLTVVQ